jgi:hypothetical protein
LAVRAGGGVAGRAGGGAELVKGRQLVTSAEVKRAQAKEPKSTA